jgi:hydroxycarboxylate dehydrogenase B
LTLVGEILAGSLTGRFSSHPNSPTAGHLVNNMTSIAFDPDVFPGHAFFGSDIDHLAAWAKASPPLKSGGSVFLPGEIEDALRAERMAKGILVDQETFAQINAAGRLVGVTVG